MKRILILLAGFVWTGIFSQVVGINTNTPDSSSVLDLYSNNKGVYIPKYSLTTITTNTTPITKPAEGLLIYNTGGIFPRGIYYWNGSQWSKFHIQGDFDEVLAAYIPNPSIVGGSGSGAPLVSSTSPNTDISGYIELANNISSGTASVNSSNGNFTLPAGKYKVYVKLDGVISNVLNSTTWGSSSNPSSAYYRATYNTGSQVNAFYQNIAVNAVLQNQNGTAITDVQTSSNLTTGAVLGFEYSFWLNLSNPTNTVRLKLYYDANATTVNTSSFPMTPQQTGLKVSFIKMQ